MKILEYVKCIYLNTPQSVDKPNILLIKYYKKLICIVFFYHKYPKLEQELKYQKQA